MSETQDHPATFERGDGCVQARFVRFFDHDAAELWRALTDPAALPLWLAPGEIEPRHGGQARLEFKDSGVVVDSTVTAWIPRRLLEYSWSSPSEPQRPVRFELTPIPGACRLDLTLTLPEAEDAGRSAAGWEAHLEMLGCALEGVPIKFPFETFKDASDRYRAELAPGP